jgi:hypothetical protein
MTIAAVAGVPSDFAELKARAEEIERHKYIPSRVETMRDGLAFLTGIVALHWDQLDEPRRDVLRHLASKLDEDQRATWFQRTAGVLRLIAYVSRYGVERTYREAHQAMEACAKFRSAVLAEEEHNNENLQAAVAEAVNSALTKPPMARLSRGQVGEWLKRLPH